MKLPFLLGRAILGGFFLYGGVKHFAQLRPMSQYAASKGVPMPEVAVAASGALLVLGGASILLGTRPKLGVAAILAFLSGVSPIMHDFWNVEPEKRPHEMVNFTKNLALAGATLALLGVEEPWPASVPLETKTPADRFRSLARRIAA
jgi:uncharacterized membrane protein YphA (DoxX/SURF4 family)